MSKIRGIIINELAKRLNAPLEEVNPDTEFFNMGIDSLDAMQIFISVQRETEHSLSPTLLFEYDTVNKIANYIESLEAA